MLSALYLYVRPVAFGILFNFPCNTARYTHRLSKAPNLGSGTSRSTQHIRLRIGYEYDEPDLQFAIGFRTVRMRARVVTAAKNTTGQMFQ